MIFNKFKMPKVLFKDGGELSNEWDRTRTKRNKSNLDYLYEQHRNSGLNHNQTLALLANYVVESGADTNQRQLNKPDVIGLLQTTDAERKRNLINYKPTYEFDGTPLNLQTEAKYHSDSILNNTNHEWRHGGAHYKFNKASDAIKKFKTSNNLDDLVTVISENFVRPGKPHLDRRKEVAHYLERTYWDNPISNIFRNLKNKK